MLTKRQNLVKGFLFRSFSINKMGPAGNLLDYGPLEWRESEIGLSLSSANDGYPEHGKVVTYGWYWLMQVVSDCSCYGLPGNSRWLTIDKMEKLLIFLFLLHGQ